MSEAEPEEEPIEAHWPMTNAEFDALLDKMYERDELDEEWQEQGRD